MPDALIFLTTETAMFYGRNRELALLRDKNLHDKAELIVIYGRRRVGKTSLIETAFNKQTIWKFEGIEGATAQEQIRHFLFLLSKYSKDTSVSNKKITGWNEAFLLLYEKAKRKKPIIFFDEFQWMASMRKNTVSLFKWAYDNYLGKLKGTKVIICGSISSFIVKKVLKSKALYGRVDKEIHLKPLSIKETAQIIGKMHSKRELLETYFVFGGIPQYLIELKHNKSLVQNLINMAFSPEGYFFNEYQRLFISHFSKNINYEKIVRVLSIKGTLSINGISHNIGIKSGGTLSKLLEDLELAGFIDKFSPLDTKYNSKLVKLRISDEFLNFYFSFVEKYRKSIENETINASEILTSPRFDQWRGYAFERFCRKNSSLISKKLGFSGITYQAGTWFRDNKENNAQIDLLFVRSDRVLTICEIKYINTISASPLINSFENKIRALKQYYSYSFQKVLILGDKIRIPQKVSNYFDTILFAEDLFQAVNRG